MSVDDDDLPYLFVVGVNFPEGDSSQRSLNQHIQTKLRHGDLTINHVRESLSGFAQTYACQMKRHFTRLGIDALINGAFEEWTSKNPEAQVRKPDWSVVDRGISS